MPQIDRTIVFIVIINITIVIIVIIVIINLVHLLGGGGVLWISRDGDYQMGAKIKTQNNP